MARALHRARAVLRGGSPCALAALPLRSDSVLLAALAVRIALYLPPLRASALVAHAGGTLYIASLGLALVGTPRNRGLEPPVWVATLGLALNATVIVANGGYMPVDAAALRAVRTPSTSTISPTPACSTTSAWPARRRAWPSSPT